MKVFISTYEEPEDYKVHDPKTCDFCQHPRVEGGQTGVLGLLEGKQMTIKPQGFDKHPYAQRGSTPPAYGWQEMENRSALAMERKRNKKNKIINVYNLIKSCKGKQMTAEIVVMNKSAVALAADSAVTIDAKKFKNL